MAYTNIGLANYARAQAEANSPYWYGCVGQIGNENLYQEKKRQYKDQYPPKKWTEESFRCQFGKKCMDCIGMTKAYLNSTSKPDALGNVPNPLAPSVYSPEYDWSANDTYKRAKEKGDIKSIPEIVGLQVWREGHVGVYLGKGLVSESKGHAYGTVFSNLSEGRWTAWFKHPAITYYTNTEYFVLRLYVLALGREPDEGGFKFWVDGLNNNRITYTQCAFNFLTSEEFVNRHLNDNDFLYVLYRTLFDREPDESGKNYWLNYLKTHSRDQVIVCFLNSDEWTNVCNSFKRG